MHKDYDRLMLRENTVDLDERGGSESLNHILGEVRTEHGGKTEMDRLDFL